MAFENSTDFDEDIVLPNSPLAHYVKGLETSEATNLCGECPTSEDDTQDELQEKEKVKKDKISFSLKTFINKRCKIFQQLLTNFFLTPSFERSNLKLKDLLLDIKKENLLIREDRAFLKSLNSDPLTVHEEAPSSQQKLYWVLLMIILALLTTVVVETIVWYYCKYLLAFALPFITGIFLYSLVHYNTIGLKYEKACTSVSILPVSTKLLLIVIKDCIRLIQEAELIARGFTKASVLGVAERIELSYVLPINSSCRQYSELRKFIFSWMREIFIDYKNLTLKLIKNMPIDPALSFPNSLASLSLEEFGGFLNYELDSGDLLNLTDNFSISSMKTIYHLMEMQISEFFKHVTVRLSFLCNDKEVGVSFFTNDQLADKCWKLISDVYWMESVVRPLDKKITLLFERAFKTYKFYQAIEASYVDDNEVQSYPESKTLKSDLKISVHNMCLHLKAALLRLIEIEGNFDAKAQPDLYAEHFEKILSLMKVVKSEVSAFEECFGESSKILDDLLNPMTRYFIDIQPSAHNSENEDDYTPVVIQKCDTEREIQDEVFEAIVSNTAAEKKQQDSATFLEEESKQNLQLSSFLLKELKNVLVVKADEHRVREQLALAKKLTHISVSDSNDNVAAEDTGCKIAESEHIQIESDRTTGQVNMTDRDSHPPITTSTTESTHQNLVPKNVSHENKRRVYFNLTDSRDDSATNFNEEANQNLTSNSEDVQCQHERTDDCECDDFVLLDKSNPSRYKCILDEQPLSFAASIAAQRQKIMCMSSEEFFDGSDDSDCENP